MFVAQMSVGFHGQRPAVLVTQPARNSRNVHAGFNTAGGKQMAEIMVSQPRNADFPTGAFE